MGLMLMSMVRTLNLVCHYKNLTSKLGVTSKNWLNSVPLDILVNNKLDLSGALAAVRF